MNTGRLLSTIWREPLVQFLLIGGILVTLLGLARRAGGGDDYRIVVGAEQIQQLADQFSRTWMRPPTESELSGLIQSHVRDEVYYREGLAMGLDRNDPLIRRRMRQKLELLLDDMATVRIPSDQVMTAFMQANEEKFRQEPQVSFRHIYLNPDRRENLEAEAREVSAELRDGADPGVLGDPTMMGYEFTLAYQSVIARSFGDAFARQILELEPGTWSGLLYSGLGGHLVLVTDIVDGRMPELSEVRADVEQEWLALRRKELKDAAYDRLLEGYDVVIESKEGQE